MFVKPFKIKSNVQLRGSDLKKFRARIEQNYPDASQSDLLSLFPLKSTLGQIKIITNSNISCVVYSIEKRPLFFEDENGILIPTVYALWLAPNILSYFTTYAAVLPKLVNGADLMLPGVIRKGSGMNAYGRYKKNQLVAVNLDSNKSAIGVGRLARSSDDLFMAAGHGVCVKMLHVFGDKLWNVEPSVTMQIPDCGSTIEIPEDNDFPELGSNISQKRKSNNQQEQQNLSGKQSIEQESQSVGNEYKSVDNSKENIGNISTIPIIVEQETVENKIDEENKDFTNVNEEDMDTILKNAFLKALKNDGKNLNLPLLTSNFYRLHVIPAASKQIDLKQTTYKKISKFLNVMSKQGFITLNEETKGIEKITSVNFKHPNLIDFIPNDNSVTEDDSKNKDIHLFHTQMTELYIVTDHTLSLFTRMNFKKGDGLQAIQIKKLLKEYISKNKLESIQNTKIIKLDQILSQICKSNELTLDQIFHAVLDKMHHTFEMRDKLQNNTGGNNNTGGGNKPPIQMTLATRSGNKKITLISNLDAYGIIISEFAKSCKIGAAASTSIVKTANQNKEQLQVQGNQIRFVYNLLTETYKIPPKHIIGLELANKEKKKKK